MERFIHPVIVVRPRNLPRGSLGRDAFFSLAAAEQIPHRAPLSIGTANCMAVLRFGMASRGLEDVVRTP